MLITVVARNHELVSVNRYNDNITTVATEAHNIIIHVVKCRPVTQTSLALAVKPVLALQGVLALFVFHLCEDWAIIFSYDFTLLDASNCSHNHFCSSVVPVS